MDLDDAFDKLMAEAQADGEEKEKKRKEKKKKKKKKKSKEHEDEKGKKRKKEDEGEDKGEEGQVKTAETKKRMIEIFCNDRLGNKVRVKCFADDTIGKVKTIIAAQSGHRADKIRLQKWYSVFKDHITLEDYEIHDGMSLELHYN